MLTGLEALIRNLARGLALIGAVTMLLMALHVSASVIWRWLFGREIPLTIEIAQYYYMVVLTFFPITLIEIYDRHIKAEFFYTMVPPLGRKVADVLVDVALLGYLLFLAWRSALNAFDRMMAGQSIASAYGNFVVWPARWVVPVGLGIAAAYVAVRVLRSLSFSDGADGGQARNVEVKYDEY